MHGVCDLLSTPQRFQNLNCRTQDPQGRQGTKSSAKEAEKEGKEALTGRRDYQDSNDITKKQASYTKQSQGTTIKAQQEKLQMR